mmetsp:Transcript_46728/g.84346  ORF Transcript_46728/g.84346 Transcript_46728/m.84346 type:complete len:207 (-) Transcript_46728:171-791(-)
MPHACCKLMLLLLCMLQGSHAAASNTSLALRGADLGCRHCRRRRPTTSMESTTTTSGTTTVLTTTVPTTTPATTVPTTTPATTSASPKNCASFTSMGEGEQCVSLVAGRECERYNTWGTKFGAKKDDNCGDQEFCWCHEDWDTFLILGFGTNKCRGRCVSKEHSKRPCAKGFANYGDCPSGQNCKRCTEGKTGHLGCFIAGNGQCQ